MATITARCVVPSMQAINVKTLGAIGNGVTDDTAAIQAAITAAAALGVATGGNAKGGEVYFPPGVYVISAPLTNPAAFQSKVNLVGSGRYCTLLIGGGGTTASNYVINQVDSAPGKIIGIEELSVRNTSTSSGSGGIYFVDIQGGYVRNVNVTAFNAIFAAGDTFCAEFHNVICTSSATAGTSGSVGIYLTQAGLYNCSFTGFDKGIVAYNSGVIIAGTRAEVNNTGMILGEDSTGAANALAGAIITAFQTERCNTGVYLRSVAGLSFNGCTITGTVGVAGEIAITASGTDWSANVVNVRKVGHGLSTGASIRVLDCNPSGYNTLAAYITRIDADNFTYPLVASDPGVFVSGNYQLTPDYGIRFGTVSAASIAGVTVSCSAGIGGIHLGSATAAQVVMNGVKSLTGLTDWVAPPANEMFDFVFNSCNISFAWESTFANLSASPLAGMEFNLSDANIGGKVLGDAITVGGSTGHIKVRRNASAWTWMGA